MAREKLIDFLNGTSTTNRVSLNPDPEDMGPTDRFNRGDDLGVDPGTGRDLLGNEGLLGDFVKYLTDISNNQFSLTGGTEEGVSPIRGAPPDNVSSAVEEFVDAVDRIRGETPGGTGGVTLGNVMSSYDRGYPELQGHVVEEFNKDGSNPTKIKDLSLEGGPQVGTTALATIVGQELNTTGKSNSGQENIPNTDTGPGIIQAGIESMLVNNSRFRNVSGGGDEGNTGFAAFAAPSGGGTLNATSFQGEGPDERPPGSISYQNTFGEYLVDPGADPTGTDPSYLADLMKVGESLIFKSAGFDSSGENPASSSGDITAANAPELSEGMFTGGQEAFKIDNLLLRARNAKGAPANDAGESVYAGRGQVLDDEGGGKSYGSTTTPATPFTSDDGQDALRAQAAAAIIAMMSIAELTYNTMSSSGGVGDEATNMFDLRKGPYMAGQSKLIARNAKFQLFRNLVVAPTVNDYKECVKQGLLVMFNKNFGEGETGSFNGVRDSQQIKEAPGYWLAISKRILISYAAVLSQLGESYTSPTADNVSSIFLGLSRTPLLRILNVAATIGDISFKMKGNNIVGQIGENTPVGPWNVDRLADGPATRISKSRSQDGQTALSLAWRTSATPAIYSIPRNVIMAAVEMGTLGNGQNPLKGMVGSQLVKKTYVDVNAENGGAGDSSWAGGTGAARIPNDIVERLENLLDAEYVPFYFHDLRTNEIVSFHAFIDSLTDRFGPEYSRTNGYGRIDSVKTYRTTSRSLNFSFYVAATSKEDFDEMWWKINKLTTLVYPQWTQGTLLATGPEENRSTFVMPFSQVLGSSPIIRIRIGDVIKSNYSKFNLARIFGIGNNGVSPKPQGDAPPLAFLSALSGDVAKKMTIWQFENIFGAIYGSPLAWFGGMGGIRALRSFASQILVNGFANPLGVNLIMREISSPDVEINPASFNITAAGAVQAGATAMRAGMGSWMGYTPTTFPYLKASTDEGYATDAGDGTRWRFARAYRVMVNGFKRDTNILSSLADANADPTFKGPRRKANPLLKTYYNVTVVDLTAPFNIIGKTFVVSHEDLMPNINWIFNSFCLPLLSITGLADSIVQAVADEVATATGIPSDQLDLSLSDAASFMRADDGTGTTVNPVVKSFESTAGRGLAGVITSLSYNWIDGTNTWEIDWNSRAPKVAKVTVSYEVIHDIPPGLDHSGFDRAPIYNVGDIMHHVAGDPYPDNGHASRDSYKSQGRLGTVSSDPGDTSAPGGDPSSRTTTTKKA